MTGWNTDLHLLLMFPHWITNRCKTETRLYSKRIRDQILEAGEMKLYCGYSRLTETTTKC